MDGDVRERVLVLDTDAGDRADDERKETAGGGGFGHPYIVRDGLMKMLIPSHILQLYLPLLHGIDILLPAL